MDGIKIMKYYKDTNNNVYAYELDGTQDELIGDKVAMTVDEIEAHINPPLTLSQVIAHLESITDAYIQSKIDAYNLANGVKFKDIDAFTKYAINTSSQHNAIANKFIAYADSIWKAVRAYQATATTIPTDKEFQAVLDGVAF
jgi:hypothetical protein